jgi:hypothetical protein
MFDRSTLAGAPLAAVAPFFNSNTADVCGSNSST